MYSHSQPHYPQNLQPNSADLDSYLESLEKRYTMPLPSFQMPVPNQFAGHQQNFPLQGLYPGSNERFAPLQASSTNGHGLYKPEDQHFLTSPHYFSSPTPPSSPPNQTKISDINNYWKGRLAPLPDDHSRPALITLREVHRVKITSPIPSNDNLNGGTKPLKISPATSKIYPIKNFDPKLDKYAESFTPNFLKEVQKRPHALTTLPPISRFPSFEYLKMFLLPSLIERVDHSGAQNTALLRLPPPSSEIQPLNISGYYIHWTDLLRLELDTVSLEREGIVLWNKTVIIADWSKSEFILTVPGIRENHPKLDLGDLIHMREVSMKMKTGTGFAFEGRVVYVSRREGLIHFYSPTLQKYVGALQEGSMVYTKHIPIPHTFNCSFLVDPRPSCVMEAAVASAVECLVASDNDLHIARKWLFPEPGDIGCQNMQTQELDWCDKGLNEEQKEAVSAVSLNQFHVPYLIGGPPGTGKTRTITEMVLQILRNQPEACILICAPSNPATDTLVQRLKDQLLPKELFRLNSQTRTFAEVQASKIMQYCSIDNELGHFTLPPWKTLMSYKVVVCSCLDASILVDARCTNRHLGEMEEELLSSLHPNRHREPTKPHWTHLLIDEAAQGSEPELLIPMSVVLPHASQTIEVLEQDNQRCTIPQLVLCGDPNQLGPIVTSDKARSGELDISLLERLFERPIYADHEDARKSIRLRNPFPLRENPKCKPFCNLVKNYRSHPAILMPPSAMFYNDTLVPCALPESGTVFWSELPNPELPLMFIGNDTPDECVGDGASWYNPGEIDRVVKVIRSLLVDEDMCSPVLRPRDMGVITPWREHVWKLRERLRKEGLSSVDVGTVEDYQGRERRVIIMSCVRSNPRFVDEDMRKGLGLIHERKRMNVAITRAMALLIVIGSGALLSQRDPHWKSFLQFALRNKLYVGPDLGMELDGNYISRLESEFHARSTGPELNPEEEVEQTAAGIAREVLRD